MILGTVGGASARSAFSSPLVDVGSEIQGVNWVVRGTFTSAQHVRPYTSGYRDIHTTSREVVPSKGMEKCMTTLSCALFHSVLENGCTKKYIYNE